MHELRYGTCAPAEPAEIVSLRSTVTGVMRKPAASQDQARPRSAARRPPSPASGRSIWASAAAFARRRPIAAPQLLAGNKIKGPALIEEHASTTVLMSGDAMTVDPYGNLLIAVAGAR